MFAVIAAQLVTQPLSLAGVSWLVLHVSSWALRRASNSMSELRLEQERLDVSAPDSKRPHGLAGWLPAVPRLLEFSWLYVIPFICILGVVVILVYASQLPSGVRWGACAVALVIGSSAFLAGGFTGFLFGIPRTITAPGPNPSTGVTQYQGNTNLEQVSDWLTKIIVGVGLVQIGHIIPALSKFAESIKAPLGGQSSSGAFGLGLAIANALMGFFFFYLWARSIFVQELKDSSK